MFEKNNLNIAIVLDNIRSMHNIGSIFRTCDAIGNCTIYLCGICAIPPNKNIHKTALGATESVNWKYYETTFLAVEKLKKNNYQTIAVEQTKKSRPLSNFSTKNKKIALIFGNEVNGVSNEIIQQVDDCIEIEQHGIKKSINVSVAAGIVLWSIRNSS